MQVKLFTIPIGDDGKAQAELNKFMAAQKVLDVQQHFMPNTNGGVWCFCVRYLSTAATIPFEQRKAAKVDYKEVLSEAEFERFALLRARRKELATQEAVPAYAIFTDAELAEMSRILPLSSNSLLDIKGIAQKRIEKYGKALLSSLETTGTDEKG